FGASPYRLRCVRPVILTSTALALPQTPAEVFWRGMAERDVQRAEEAREELNSVDKATVRVGCCLDLLAWASRSVGQAPAPPSPEGEEQGPPPKITIP